MNKANRSSTACTLLALNDLRKDRRLGFRPVLCAARCAAEALERRTLLTASVAPPDPVVLGDSISGPLAPEPGHSVYVSKYNVNGSPVSKWASDSAITPNTAGDLVLNAVPSSTNYVAAFEGAGGTLGAALLTNGLTQDQTAPPPTPTQPAIGTGHANDPSNNADVISKTSSTYFFTYQLGTVGGATPSANGYDLSEIDVISGHNDYRTQINLVDIQVEPVGSSQFLSLSNSQGFTLTSVPDGQGGSLILFGGSAQMAIVNDAGGALAQNVQAIKFVATDPSTWLRELVVTGVPSSAPPAPSAPAAPTAVAAAAGPSGVVVSWNGSSSSTGYVVSRSTNGAAGPFTTIGSTLGQTSLLDPSAVTAAYKYEVIASGNGDSAASAPSAPFSGVNAVVAYMFFNQYWAASSDKISELIPKINYGVAGPDAQVYPYAKKPQSPFSVLVEGKITTGAAGTYTFLTRTGDYGFLYVNGQLVSQDASAHLPRDATTLNPIDLAGNTAYDFVLLESSFQTSTSFDVFWKEPGSPSFTPTPSTRLAPNIDTPAAPQNTSASIDAGGAVRVNWNAPSDYDSFGYLIQRATVNPMTGLPGSYSTLSQVFSGPAPAASVGPAQWGVSSYLDTSALPSTTYVYRVGVIAAPDFPANFGAVTSSIATSSATVSAAISADGTTLNVTFSGAGNLAKVSVNGSNNVVVSDAAGATVYSASLPASVVNFGAVGRAGYHDSLTIQGLALSGAISISQVFDLTLTTVSAGSLSLTATDNIEFGGLDSANGPISVSAANTLTVDANSSLNSNGHNISTQYGTLSLSGTINAGSGDILLSGLHWSGAIFARTISSGTITQVAPGISGLVRWNGTVGTGLTGTFIFDMPDADIDLFGMDVHVGNPTIQVIAKSIDVTGAVNAGSGQFILNAPYSVIEAAMASSGTIATDGVTNIILGGSLSASNAGAIKPAQSISLNGGSISGAVSGGGPLHIPAVQSGTLTGVTLTNINLVVGEQATVTIQNGLTLAGTAAISYPANSTWNIGGSVALMADTGKNLLINAVGDTNLQLVDNGSATINSGSGTLTISISGSGDPLVNMGDGSIDLTVPAGCNATVNLGSSNGSLTIEGAGNTLLIIGTGSPSVVFLTQTTGGSPSTGSIAGSVFNDTNDNGRRDPGEKGIAGRKVFLDLNHNGRRDGGEPSAITGLDGSYQFNALKAGDYLVRETTVSGWRATTPALVNVALTAGDNIGGKDFGQTNTARISGFLFNDKNGNGKHDSDENNLGGRVVFIDANHNGKLDAGERRTLTASDGSFVFDGLVAGAYVIRAIAPAGWINEPVKPLTVKVGSGGRVSEVSLGQRRS